jgi:hypothetical protein
MKTYLIAFSISVLMTCISCSPKGNSESSTEQADDSEWVDMDSFHLMLTEAFHPYKDSANLEPARQIAKGLAANAEMWASHPLPEKVNNHEVRAKLTKLKLDTRSLATMISDGTADEEIGTALLALHDSFHGIMEAWHTIAQEH